MTRDERIRAVLGGQEIDRVPASVWMHISEFDQDPRLWLRRWSISMRPTILTLLK